ncbi:hypothetical protein [Agromyces humi]|uniref:hypothetical protein n=1 Tax=Agromyces humi TaxID=1766800 RepID=UPI00135CA727|nr:hypothetical protein [Agromyces humi]
MRSAPKHRGTNRRRFNRTLIIAALGAAILTVPTVAMAATVGGDAIASVGAIVPMADDYGGITAFPDPNTQGGNSKLIPLNRWSESTTSLHARPGGDILAQVWGAVSDGVTGTSLAWNSGLWTATNALSNFAANLEPIKAVGAQIDFATRNLGDMLLANPLIFILVSLGLVIGGVWAKSRGRSGTGMFKRSMSVVLVIAAISVMAIGARGSTGGENGEEYRAGTGSPGWVLTKVTDTVGAVTNGLVGSITSSGFSTTDELNAAGTSMNCDVYLQNLRNFFTQSKRLDANQADAVSALWLNTGRVAWTDAQFGSDNPYADRVWCHYADLQAGVTPERQIWLTSLGVDGGEKLRTTANKQSKAFGVGSDAYELDRTMIGWAACQWAGNGWAVDGGFAKKKDGSDWITPGMCNAWWTGDQKTNISDGKDGGAAFDISTGGGLDQNIEDYTDNEQVLNFVRSWQGTDTGFGASITAGWALVAGLVCFLLFGLILSGAIIWAKFMGVLLMAMLVITLLASLFSTDGAGKRSAELAKQLVGFTVVAAGASAIMVLVSWLTHTLVVAGKSLIGGEVLWALIWTALAPILAVLVLHHTFQKMFKKPSPFTLKGLNAWGGAGAAAAGGILAGGAMERWKNRGQAAVEGKGKEIGNRALNRMTAGRLGAPGSSAPGAGKPAVGAGAPPKAVGAVGARGAQLAAKDDLKAVEEHWKGQGNKVPMTATQRAGRAVLAGGSAVAGAGATAVFAGLGHKASQEKVGELAKGVKTNVAGAAKRSVSGYKDTAYSVAFAGLATKEALKNPEYRQQLRQSGGAAVKTAAKQSVTRFKDSYQSTLNKVHQTVTQNPAGAAKTVGLAAAGVAATALTGGAAGLVLAPIAVGSKIRRNHHERATAHQEMHASFAQEQQRQKQEDEQRVRAEVADAKRAEKEQAKLARKAASASQSVSAQAPSAAQPSAAANRQAGPMGPTQAPERG